MPLFLCLQTVTPNLYHSLQALDFLLLPASFPSGQLSGKKIQKTLVRNFSPPPSDVYCIHSSHFPPATDKQLLVVFLFQKYTLLLYTNSMQLFASLLKQSINHIFYLFYQCFSSTSEPFSPPAWAMHTKLPQT